MPGPSRDSAILSVIVGIPATTVNGTRGSLGASGSDAPPRTSMAAAIHGSSWASSATVDAREAEGIARLKDVRSVGRQRVNEHGQSSRLRR